MFTVQSGSYVTDYHSLLSNIPEQRRPQLRGSRNL